MAKWVAQAATLGAGEGIVFVRAYLQPLRQLVCSTTWAKLGSAGSR